MSGAELLMAAVCGVGLAAITVGVDQGPGAACRRCFERATASLPGVAGAWAKKVSSCVLCASPYLGLVAAGAMAVLPGWGDLALAGAMGAPGLLWLARGR
jgi:hypothetical protein